VRTLLAVDKAAVRCAAERGYGNFETTLEEPSRSKVFVGEGLGYSKGSNFQCRRGSGNGESVGAKTSSSGQRLLDLRNHLAERR
jgi:hypothetical protein